MQWVPIDEIPESAVLAEPLLDDGGKILLRRGTALTPSLIGHLQSWSVTMVAIEDGQQQAVQAPRHVPSIDEWKALLSPYQAHAEMLLIEKAFERWSAAREASSRQVTQEHGS
ncbi:MAG: hypothetical protein ACE5GW_08415 [Planctomycetota bacterium]